MSQVISASAWARDRQRVMEWDRHQSKHSKQEALPALQLNTESHKPTFFSVLMQTPCSLKSVGQHSATPSAVLHLPPPPASPPHRALGFSFLLCSEPEITVGVYRLLRRSRNLYGACCFRFFFFWCFGWWQVVQFNGGECELCNYICLDLNSDFNIYQVFPSPSSISQFLKWGHYSNLSWLPTTSHRVWPY